MLLRDGDASPVEIINPGGTSPFLLTGDHAGNVIPQSLGTLGVSAEDLQRHIAWDIGVEALGRDLSSRLDAAFIRQHYSRLVIDCNRDPASADAMPEVSDGTAIPGNVGLDCEARNQRIAEIQTPYQTAIASTLTDRTILIALHSFTPTMAGITRPWEIGVLHNGHNDGFARRLLAWLQQNSGLTIGDNEPYQMDATDYTVPRHAFTAGLPYVELEIRQDILAANVPAIADLLTKALI